MLAGLAVAAYLALLLWMGNRSAVRGDMADFALGGHRSPWWAVAFGMIGTSLSGVTFLSVPGWVGDQQFGYMQMVLGYLVVYGAIIGILLPCITDCNHQHLPVSRRPDRAAVHHGSMFFLMSRSIGAAFRLYLVALVIQETVLPAARSWAWIPYR